MSLPSPLHLCEAQLATVMCAHSWTLFLDEWFISICVSCAILSHGLDQFIPATSNWRNSATTHPLEGKSNKVWTHFFIVTTGEFYFCICYKHLNMYSLILKLFTPFHRLQIPYGVISLLIKMQVCCCWILPALYKSEKVFSFIFERYFCALKNSRLTYFFFFTVS